MIFLYPALTSHRVIAKNLLFTAIILSGIFSLDFKEKTRRILMVNGMATVILIWLDWFFPSDLLELLAFFAFFSFIFFITVFMVRHVARSKHVDITIIVNSINGYLLFGVLGAVLLAMTEVLQHFDFLTGTAAIAFADGATSGFHDYLYFSFVTLTTLGYGDVTPVSSLAKSITVIIALIGQLYLTILIAFLVGKFLSRKED
ncbi:potassium channel family protein [Thermodesulfobacteriota bacterium]